MNLAALMIAAVIILGALLSPLMLVWAIYCLRRPDRRAEGASTLVAGALAAAAIVVIGAMTAPPGSAGVLRPQALVVIAGIFGLGAAGGEVLHVILHGWRTRRFHHRA